MGQEIRANRKINEVRGSLFFFFATFAVYTLSKDIKWNCVYINGQNIGIGLFIKIL